MAYTLDCYGYKDASTPIVSAKQQQKSIDAGQDKKIKELETAEGGGGKTPKETLVETTYLELVGLRDKGKLIPGCKYRITDYTATVTEDDYVRSAGHQFDIIVTATSNNTVSEKALAIQHEGDTYFSNCDLNAWELDYTLDNKKFFPSDGVVITVSNVEKSPEFSEDGNFVVYPGQYGVLDYNGEEATTLIKSGTTEMVYNETIPSAGTYATVVAVDGDDNYFIVKKGEEKLTVLSGGTFVSTNDVYGGYCDLQTLGDAIVESGGTFGVFYLYFGEKNNMLFNGEKYGSVNVPQQNFAKISLLPGTNPWEINELTIIKSGTTEISGETMVVWATLLGAPIYFVSRGDKVGDNVYYAEHKDGFKIIYDEPYEILSIGTKKSKTYTSWVIDRNGGGLVLLSDGQNTGSTSYIAYIVDGFAYVMYDFPLQFIAKDVVSDGQRCFLWKSSNGAVCSFGNSVGSALYEFSTKLSAVITSESDYTTTTTINILIGDSLLFPIQKSETIKDGDSVFSWSFNGIEGAVSLTDTVGSTMFLGDVFSGDVYVLEALGTIDAIEIIDDDTQPIVWYDFMSDRLCISFNENSGFMTYYHDDYETSPIGKVNEKIEIPEGTLYKKFSQSKVNFCAVGPSDYVGSYVYAAYVDGDFGPVAFSEKGKITSKQTVYSGGKGIITRMKDDYGNDLPYDFKNIQFRRWKVDEEDNSSFSGLYVAVADHLPMWFDPRGGSFPMVSITDESIWCYTFSTNPNGGEQRDASILQLASHNEFLYDGFSFDYDYGDYMLSNNVLYCYNENSLAITSYNKICGYSNFNTIVGSSSGNTIGSFLTNLINDGFVLNNIGIDFNGNLVGYEFQNNTIGNTFWANRIGDGFKSNVLDVSFAGYNKVGVGFTGNTVGSHITGVAFGDYVSDNYFGGNFGQTYQNRVPRIHSDCKSNFIERDQQDINLEGNNSYNHICSGSKNLNFGSGASNNFVGGYSNGVKLSENSKNIVIGNGCDSINFNKSYTENVCVEDGNKNITITSTQTTSASNKLCNFIVGRGVNNTTTTKTISHDTVNDTIRTTYEPSGSTIVNI